MKMEHEVRAAPCGPRRVARGPGGRRRRHGRSAGDDRCRRRSSTSRGSSTTSATPEDATDAPMALRADLLELQAREALLADASRPEAVAKRHALGLRTARENVADLCDAGSFVEYGALAHRRAAQPARARRPDPQHAGRRHGHRHRQHRPRARSAQSARAPSSWPTTPPCSPARRAFATTRRPIACSRSRFEQRLPVVLFAEGGGGRPGDVDMPIVAGLHVPTFASFARLERPGAAHRCRRRALLRGQRGARRLLRRDHRHARQLDRHGRPGDGRRRRASACSRRRRSARATCSRARA